MKLQIKHIIYTLLIVHTTGIVFAGDPVSPEEKALAKQWMDTQPVRFLENKGQMKNTNHEPVPFVLFKAEAPGMNLYVTEKGLTYTFFKIEKDDKKKEEEETGKDFMLEWEKGKKRTEMAWISMHLKGASIKKENIIREGESREHFNYFYGHCPEGIYGVKQYEKITIKNVYPGIDWVLYNSNNKGFKYDFVVHPNADPSQIKLIYESEKPLETDEDGNLHIRTHLGELTENAPYSYIYETGKPVRSHFTKKIIDEYHTEVSFSLPYGEGRGEATLIIDPQLVWGTFYGGNSHEGFMRLTHDSNDNLFIAAYTISPNFPVKQYDTSYYQGWLIGIDYDCAILKFDDAGAPEWATYYGGNGVEDTRSIACDYLGNIFLTGFTNSIDFPLRDAGTFFDNTTLASVDAFILKFDNVGNRLWATYYGGAGFEIGRSITCDHLGNIFISGQTGSSIDFPLFDNGTYFDSALGGGLDAFISKFDNSGNQLWSTYYGGSNNEDGYSLSCDNSGNVFVTGWTRSADFPFKNAGTYIDSTLGGNADIYILKFDNAGNDKWATLYGGSDIETSNTIACDNLGNVFLTGPTLSSDFPLLDAGGYIDNTLGGVRDAFILQFDTAGNALWATYYGGSGNEFREDLSSSGYIAFLNDSCFNSIYISFETFSNDITTLNPGCGYTDSTFGGNVDVFITNFSYSKELLWATYIGGNRFDFRVPLAVDGKGNLFAGGEWATYNPLIIAIPPPRANPGGGAYYDDWANGGDDSFIVKFEKDVPIYTQSQQDPNMCLCNGSATIIVKCGYPPYSYIWSNGVQSMNDSSKTHTITGLCEGETPSVTVYMKCDTLSATYTMGVTGISLNSSSDSICIGDSTTLSVSGAGTFNWSPAYGLSNTTGTSVTAGPDSSVTYTVIGNEGTCSDTAYITLTVNPLPVAIGNSNSPVCQDDTIHFSAMGGNSYSWSGPDTFSDSIQSPFINNATAMNNGIYTVIVTDINGCSDADSVIVLVYELTVDTSSTSTTCFEGDDGEASVSVSGGSGFYSYNWSSGGQTNNIASGLPAGSYTVTITDNSTNCTYDVTITINQPPAMVPEYTIDAEICGFQNGSVTVNDVAYGTVPFSYSWNGLPPVADNKFIHLRSGIYQIIITDAKACTITDSVVVEEAVMSFKADFGYELIPCTNEVQFLNLSSDTLYAQWDFGDGTTSNEYSPLHIYQANEKYTVILILAPNSPCADTTQAIIPFENEAVSDTLLIPNVFTPNGDGKNDYFEIIGVDNPCINLNKLMIFNRWGLKVFEATGSNLKWDGTYNENALAGGVYFYVLEGEEFTRSGSVTLLR